MMTARSWALAQSAAQEDQGSTEIVYSLETDSSKVSTGRWRTPMVKTTSGLKIKACRKRLSEKLSAQSREVAESFRPSTTQRTTSPWKKPIMREAKPMRQR